MLLTNFDEVFFWRSAVCDQLPWQRFALSNAVVDIYIYIYV